MFTAHRFQGRTSICWTNISSILIVRVSNTHRDPVAIPTRDLENACSLPLTTFPKPYSYTQPKYIQGNQAFIRIQPSTTRAPIPPHRQPKDHHLGPRLSRTIVSRPDFGRRIRYCLFLISMNRNPHAPRSTHLPRARPRFHTHAAGNYRPTVQKQASGS